MWSWFLLKLSRKLLSVLIWIFYLNEDILLKSSTWVNVLSYSDMSAVIGRWCRRPPCGRLWTDWNLTPPLAAGSFPAGALAAFRSVGPSHRIAARSAWLRVWRGDSQHTARRERFQWWDLPSIIGAFRAKRDSWKSQHLQFQPLNKSLFRFCSDPVWFSSWMKATVWRVDALLRWWTDRSGFLLLRLFNLRCCFLSKQTLCSGWKTSAAVWFDDLRRFSSFSEKQLIETRLLVVDSWFCRIVFILKRRNLKHSEWRRFCPTASPENLLKSETFSLDSSSGFIGDNWGHIMDEMLVCVLVRSEQEKHLVKHLYFTASLVFPEGTRKWR